MAEEVVPVEPLQSKEQAALLDAIDSVRALGVGYEIPLPQLIVVGDQSSGKSSVLEAVSGFKFPVDDGTCTRFATEVVMRRSAETSASVSIRAAPSQTNEHKTRVAAFHAKADNLEQLPDLINEARECMGIDATGGFSEDVLQVQRSGPHCSHLTLVDLPGLIHSTSENLTIQDKSMVRRLVEGYMSQTRSIILAIVSAQNDPENQVIFDLARERDPDGKRTMGIITKPDLAKTGSNRQRTYLSYAQEKDNVFKLGWHVVRNADFDEKKTKSYNRDKEEMQFFNKPPWDQIMPSKCGIKSLSNRLSECLLSFIRSELPIVIQEIESAIYENKIKLKRLGTSRASVADKRDYLSRIGNPFHDIVRDAANGNYNDDYFKDDSSRKLRGMIKTRSKSFASVMRGTGHAHEIYWKDQVVPPDQKEDIARAIWKSELMKLIVAELNNSQGRTLPSAYDYRVVGPPFTAMSGKWVQIGESFAMDVWDDTNIFLEDLLYDKCEADTCMILIQELVEPAMEARRVALMEKIAEVATPYTRGLPMTFNETDFLRAQEHVSKLIPTEYNHFARELRALSIFDSSSRDIDINACASVFAQVQAMYQVGLPMFVDNVASLAVENCLVRGLEDIFSSSLVAKMDVEQLESLAAESPENITRRQFLQRQNVALEKALSACKHHAKIGTHKGQNARKITSVRQDKPQGTLPKTAKATANATNVFEPFITGPSTTGALFGPSATNTGNLSVHRTPSHSRSPSTNSLNPSTASTVLSAGASSLSTSASSPGIFSFKSPSKNPSPSPTPNPPARGSSSTPSAPEYEQQNSGPQAQSQPQNQSFAQPTAVHVQQAPNPHVQNQPQSQPYVQSFSFGLPASNHRV